MIRQNRAVPILLVLTFAFILYLGGCFDSDASTIAEDETPTPLPISTPAPVVDPEIDIPASEEEPFYYTVENGDLLGSIASKFNVNPDVIIRANPDLDPNIIIAGQRLLIPGAGTNPEVVEDVSCEARADNLVINYVVESGDTLGGIASRCTVTLDALQEVNPDVDASTLQPNQILVIPPWGTGFDSDELQPRTTPVASTREPGDPPLEHIVAAGDIISTIAELYNVTRSQIVVCNNLDNAGNNINVGQVLLIPPPESDACPPVS